MWTSHDVVAALTTYVRHRLLHVALQEAKKVNEAGTQLHIPVSHETIAQTLALLDPSRWF